VYAWRQRAAFSFAAGHPSLDKYSFDVRDASNETIMSRASFVVPIDSLCQRKELLGRTLTLTAKYNGKLFRFVTPRSQKVDSSTWTFRISSPQPILITLWRRFKDYEKLGAPVLDLGRGLKSAWIEPPSFRLMYQFESGGGYFYESPSFTRHSARMWLGKNAQTLTEGPFTIPTTRSFSTGAFEDIVLGVLPQEVEGTSRDAPRFLKIELEYDTYFEKNVKETYCAWVYSQD
jgi:hypothetical protein